MPPVKKSKHDRARTFLREWRKFRQLTQARAAERVEIDEATLSRIERGHLPYNQDLLERLAHAYTCEVSDLLTINPMAPDKPRLIYDRLRAAPQDVQAQAVAVLEALLKAS